jgi:hypothetical protein
VLASFVAYVSLVPFCNTNCFSSQVELLTQQVSSTELIQHCPQPITEAILYQILANFRIISKQHLTTIFSKYSVNLHVGFEVLTAVDCLLPASRCFKQTLLTTCFMLVSCVAYSSTLKMEETCSSERALGFQRTTWRYIPEDKTLCKLTLSDCWVQWLYYPSFYYHYQCYYSYYFIFSIIFPNWMMSLF